MFSGKKRFAGLLLTLLVLLLAVVSCMHAEEIPTKVEELRGLLTSTETPTTVPTAVPVVELPTETPVSASEMATPTMPATPIVPPAQTSTPQHATGATLPSPTSALFIRAFNVVAEDVGTGKRLTFTWETSGASTARIVSGTSQRFARWWDVLPSGTLTVELPGTNYRDPTMALMAQDQSGNQVIESVIVDWPCQYDYFFDPAPIMCPSYEATFTSAAEQAFQNGRTIWLEEIRGIDVVTEGVILILYNDNQWQSFDDTWTSEDLESDPGVVPPEGLLQPVRGFGKIWRGNESVREKLGWALSPERGFESAWQWQAQESLPAIAYVRTIDGDVIRLYGSDSGNWEYVTP